jgi:hypothetical protein
MTTTEFNRLYDWLAGRYKWYSRNQAAYALGVSYTSLRENLEDTRGVNEVGQSILFCILRETNLRWSDVEAIVRGARVTIGG